MPLEDQFCSLGYVFTRCPAEVNGASNEGIDAVGGAGAISTHSVVQSLRNEILQVDGCHPGDLGVMLMVQIANWLDITSFDQTYVVGNRPLATISNLCERRTQPSTIERSADADPRSEIKEVRHVVAGDAV